MLSGIALWLYGEKSLSENVSCFVQSGFRAVSCVGRNFTQFDDGAQRELAGLLREHGLALTIHHKLPDPENREETGAFAGEIAMIRRFHDALHPVAGVTFDKRNEFDLLRPHFRGVLETFRDTDTFVCCEDFPLNDEQLASFDGLEREFPNLGVLIDLGHLSMRVMKEDLQQDRARAVRRHIRAVPLTIRELHVHNNDGYSDEHADLATGTLPVEAAADALREIGFDGISTIEFVPEWNDVHGEAAYDLADASRSRWEAALGARA